ncbi:uncharacterized protein (TIGR02246 family) [Flavobacterium chryseum]|uniref:YybH family protein n=1 Tax=Flavobacterium sp. P3160 TaxID=2512113 RepID=UPI00105F92F3|nr:SgcJ/EcaC family oxidoreductase [Flavobacterium sp. P3160]TDO82771.1 uncharacterized protein (TIGR02246 family) [Flavobacterium sp. P3160]
MNKIFTIYSMTLVFIFTLQNVVAQVDTANDKDAIKQLVTNYEKAWNRHDPKGLADNYDNNATWVNWFGAYYIGKEDIQNHYEIVHTSYFKSSHYYTRAVEDIIFVKPDVAISHIRTGLSGDTRFPGQTFEFRRTIILTKKDGIWLILAGQNAKLNDGIK